MFKFKVDFNWTSNDKGHEKKVVITLLGKSIWLEPNTFSLLLLNYLVIRGDRNGHVGEHYEFSFSASTEEACRKGQHFSS